MDDTRARFLTAIAGRLGADRIVELHLFSPIRQGGGLAGGAEGAGCGEGEGKDSGEGEVRLVVFTARYRLTRKGPDRGKWLFECGATADAPLATVDAVARGVTQRSKDLTETERLSGDQLRTLLQDPS